MSETTNELENKTFVITGSVKHYQNRDALKADIEAHGGKVVGSVSSKVNYLINNDINSTSSTYNELPAYMPEFARKFG